jgi:hypothetical protein
MSQCAASIAGMRTVVQTLRLQGRRVLEYLHQAVLEPIAPDSQLPSYSPPTERLRFSFHLRAYPPSCGPARAASPPASP